MVLIPQQEKLYTAEEFLEFAALPENEDRRFELFDGILEEMAPSSNKNTIITGIIITFLNNFVLPRKLGYVTVPDGGFQLAPNRILMPDAAFISHADQLENKVFTIAPDLAVEVISDSEKPSKVSRKVRAYLEAGTKMVWTVYPDDQVVEVHRLQADGAILTYRYGIGDSLDGGEVLVGFSLAVKDIFPA